MHAEGTPPPSTSSSSITTNSDGIMPQLTRKSLLFLSFNLIYLMITDIAVQSASESYNISCKYDSTSNFKKNLESVLANLPNTNSGYGFFNFSSGQNPDKAYAIALCRGDIESNSCDSCLSNSMVKMKAICTDNYEDGIGCFEECMLKYSNEEILGRTTAGDLPITSRSNQKVTDVDGFDQDVLNLMDSLKIRASREGPLRKYAADKMTRADSSRIFGVVQCTPDLSQQQCNSCLTDAVGHIAGCCSGDSGARVFLPLCNLRYENYLFYGEAVAIPRQPSQTPPSSPPASQDQQTSPPPSQASPTSPPRASTGKKTTLIIIVTLTVVFAMIIAFVCTIVIWRKKMMPTKSAEAKPTEPDVTEFSEYDFGKVRASTNYFSKENKIGQGGFGSVYKGKLEDERLIAVKRLSTDAGQIEPQEFRNLVSLVAKIQHQNLVRLLGFSLEGKERLLIYEFLPNASLDHFLFDPKKRELLDWCNSYKIIKGVAEGLLYLHENSHLSIIHLRLKASNVLLDSDMNPKITDFGMTKFFAPGGSQGNTTTTDGTDGYMPPEYERQGPFSVKLDVFSFGVLVLEIIKGQMHQYFQNDGVNLLSYAWRSWRDKRTSNITDSRLSNEQNSSPHISRNIHIALLCVQESAVDRPTMSLVVEMMNNDLVLTQEPSEPAYYNNNGTYQPSEELALLA